MILMEVKMNQISKFRFKIRVTQEKIRSVLENLRPSGDQHSAKCPQHDDEHNSLSVKFLKNGLTMLHCHAGCSGNDVFRKIESLADASYQGQSQEIEAIYDYKDEKSEVLYQVVRFAGKKFRQRHVDKDGKEAWNLEGVRRIPYNLPELLALSDDDAVIMTEGEKDADILRKHGLIATSHKNWRPEFNYLFTGRNAIICQDHDQAGVAHAQRAVDLIHRDAKDIKIIDCFSNEDLPEKHGKDVADFLENHPFEEFVKLMQDTAVYEPISQSQTIKEFDGFSVINMADVTAKEISWLWKPFIPLGEFTILEGIEGLGKSWLCYAIACAVATGSGLPFHEGDPIKPSNVLLLSAEDSLEHVTRPRLELMKTDLRRIYAIEELFSLDNFIESVQFERAIATYEPKLVLIDPLFSYTGGKNLNQEWDSRAISGKLLITAQKYGCAILGVRHIGKQKGNGDARAAGLGSISWRACARSVLLVGQDPETSEKAVCQTKNNLARPANFSVGFEILNGEFLWKEIPSSLTQEKMLARPQHEDLRTEQIEAIQFLQESLREGERPSKEIENEARLLGITKYGLRKAKGALGIKPFKKGGYFGGEKAWFLKLKEVEKPTEDTVISNTQHLQQNDSNKAGYINGLAEGADTLHNQHL
jgi:hypothetical protein